MSRQLTQRQVVLAVLSDGGWHSSAEFIDDGVLRAAARAFELRCSSFPIETRRVERPGSTPIFEYRLPVSATPDDPDPNSELERIRRKFLDLGAGA